MAVKPMFRRYTTVAAEPGSGVAVYNNVQAAPFGSRGNVPPASDHEIWQTQGGGDEQRRKAERISVCMARGMYAYRVAGSSQHQWLQMPRRAAVQPRCFIYFDAS